MINKNHFSGKNPFRGRDETRKRSKSGHLKPAASPQTGSRIWQSEKSGGRRGRTASYREELPPLLIKNVDRCRLIYKLFYRGKKEKSTIEKFALCPTSTYTRRACAFP